MFAADAIRVKVRQATYLPFGEVLATSGNPIQLLFPGQWFQAESGLHQNWMRDYDPTTGRYLQSDPLGLVDGASVYGYARQNPLRYMDPRGEELRIYSSDAWGVEGLNHTYLVWIDDECGCYADGIGTNGSSGNTRGDGVTDLDSPYRVILPPSGMSERGFFRRVQSAPSWNNGLYTPFINDCHNDLARALKYGGLENPPGAPNGRFDFDNNLAKSIGDGVDTLDDGINDTVGWINGETERRILGGLAPFWSY